MLIYTGAVHDKDGNFIEQYQNLAFSTDIEGLSWQFYEHNPVLRLNYTEKDFRDPKVLWYAEGQKWVMSVSLSSK